MAGVGHTLLRSQGWRHGLQVSARDYISVPRVNCWVSPQGGAMHGLLFTARGMPLHVKTTGGASDCGLVQGVAPCMDCR